MTMTKEQIDAACDDIDKLIVRATLAVRTGKMAVAEECLRQCLNIAESLPRTDAAANVHLDNAKTALELVRHRSRP